MKRIRILLLLLHAFGVREVNGGDRCVSRGAMGETHARGGWPVAGETGCTQGIGGRPRLCGAAGLHGFLVGRPEQEFGCGLGVQADPLHPSAHCRAGRPAQERGRSGGGVRTAAEDAQPGKDADITWRHLASQTSGYGLAEAPGAAYSYNDFALTLYYDLLTQQVFQTNGTEVLRTRLAEPLQFEDAYTFNAFRRADRDGRLALSVRDFARFGLLYLRNGRWRDRQVVRPEFIRMAINSPISAETPLTSGREAEMLPGQHSIGGTRNITPVGPGYYSFNWWLNRTNLAGQRLFVDAPPDTYVASGHGGKRALWIFPSLDLIVCWNDSPIDDHDQSPGNPDTKLNQAARLMVAAATQR